MIRVMIVDDEPFIAQGLSILIDWAAEGCEIVKTAVNGLQALEYVKTEPVDLILLDVQMPEMTGLEFLKVIREQKITKAKVLILSGYNDFSYAQRAIQYQCEGYLLKPVQKEQLLEYIGKVRKALEASKQEVDAYKRLEKGYLEQVISSMIRKEVNEDDCAYIKKQFQMCGEVRFIHISLDPIRELEEMMDEEIEKLRNRLYECCCTFLGADKDRCQKRLMDYEGSYEIALIYSADLAQKRQMTGEEFLRQMMQYIKVQLGFGVVCLVGKAVDGIEKLSFSYVSANNMKSARSMYSKKDIYIYENDLQVQENKIVLCKKSLDRLIRSIQDNDQAEMSRAVEMLFKEMEQMGDSEKLISMNLNYLMFQMVHLAIERDESVNQEEIINYIGEITVDSATDPRSKAYMKRFVSNFSEYLIQLQKNHSVGVLSQIEKEIQENYSQNLTLRELGKKYYINSSYLGQMFRKKYGQSFKDYLSNYRINEAAKMLVTTDRRIIDISEEVGYHDMDYFISRFIACKGCTPARYRKNHQETK